MNNRFKINFIKAVVSSNKFMTSLLLLIILNFFIVGKYAANLEYITAFININNLFIYNTFLAIIILFTTLNTLKIFETYTNIIIRYTNKKMYIFELIKITLILNLIIVLISYMLLFIGLNFYANAPLIINNGKLGISNLIYACYVFIKKIILFEILSIIFLLINKNFKKNISLIISFVIISMLFVATYNDIYINSFREFRFLLWDYFVYHRYASIALEISFFSIFACCNILLLYLFTIITINRIKNIGD